MKRDREPTPPQPETPTYALAAARALLAGTPEALDTLPQEVRLPEGYFPPSPPSDINNGVNYAVQFLTYAYAVPFRLVALQQELTDVFGFTGVFDAAFHERWKGLSAPEQAAFSQSYREYRRMQALGRNFAEADRGIPEDESVDDRAGRFVAAHIDGLEQWQEVLRREAASAAALNLTPDASGRSEVLPAVSPTSPPLSRADALPTHSVNDPSPGRALLSSLGAGERGTVSSILDSLAPIDELASVVLEALCAHEMADAQGRFLARVRWMLGLPNQQRMAVALRTVGRKRREIAKAMGISEESVKTHLARADDDWANLPDTLKRGSAPTSRRKRA